MSIYPKEIDRSRIKYHWDTAALDIPVPSDMTKQEDVLEWQNYLKCLSPFQKLRKLGQALDALHVLDGSLPEAELRSDEQRQLVKSAWTAASIACGAASQGFFFWTEERSKGGHDSDMLNGLDCILDFLRNVNSPDVKAWEERFQRLEEVEPRVFIPAKPDPAGPSL